MKKSWSMGVVVILLTTMLQARASVLVDEQFNGTELDSTTWTTLTTTPAGSTGISLANGFLTIMQSEGTTSYYGTGIRSQTAYAVPSGQTLVVDFYGTNLNSYYSTSDSQMCYPIWAISANGYTGYFDKNSISNTVCLYGSSQYGNDRFMGRGSIGTSASWADLGAKPTYNKNKHVIFTIDESYINCYIADDYYENLSNPTSVKTWATSNIFTSAQLTNGLYVYALMENYNSVTKKFEKFDGIKVSTVPEPMTLIMLGTGLLGILRRKA